jgi:glycosyltransferase involved in cell wall biosynthesis
MEGMPRYIYETTRQMALDHPHDTFIMFFDRKPSQGLHFPDNVRKVMVPWQARHPLIWHVWLEFMLPLYFRIYKIDVFYSGDGYLSLNTRVPTVMVLHDLAYLYYPEQIKWSSLVHYKYFVPRYLKKAHSVITVSEFVRKDLISRFNLSDTAVSVAYNAVNKPEVNDDNPFSEIIAKATGGMPYFLYVGAIHPRKNIVRMIEAFHMFNTENGGKYRLLIAGRLAWKTQEIKPMLYNTPGVVYLGSVSEEEKALLLKRAFALVYVSLMEGFGIPLLEAMQMGIPVITSSVASMPEVAGDAALLADPMNVREIAHAMNTLTNVRKVYQSLEEKGPQRAQFFQWHKSAAIIYAALEDAFSKAKNHIEQQKQA